MKPKLQNWGVSMASLKSTTAVIWALGALVGASAGFAAEVAPASAPTSAQGEKHKSEMQHQSEQDKTVTVVPTEDPGKTPGQSSGQLGPGRQSSVAAGIQIKFGTRAKPKPKRTPQPVENHPEKH